MSRPARRVTATFLAAVVASVWGCGDPVVIQGDLPGIMRIVAGRVPGDPSSSGLELVAPRGAATSDDGALYVVDTPARAVYEVLSSGITRTVVSHAACTGSLCMSRPERIAVDVQGALLVADPGAGRVWRVEVATGAVAVVAGSPGAEPARPGAQATEVSLDEPSGVAVAADGGVYFAERNAHRIWRVERTGELTAVAGDGTGGHRDGAAGQARFRLPAGLALAGSVLWVADQGNHRVRAVDLAAGTVSSPVGQGTPSFGGDNGPARNATLSSPGSVAVTGDGVSLFVADKGNNRIRRVNLVTGVIVTFAGTGDDAFAGSGLEAGATPLSSPSGVAVLASSYLFMTDTGNRLVWRTPVGR